MPTNSFPIEDKMVAVIRHAGRKNENRESSAAWTFSIKKSLTNLGHKLDYKVFASGPKKLNTDSGEWLFDLCWADLGKNWRDLKGLKLISEIERQNDDDNILKDFRKLTVGIAEFRLFVTTYKEGKKGERKLLDSVNLCKSVCPGSRGFRYLYVASSVKHPGRIKKFAWTV
ncbi:MAG: hypothetical protein KGJ89_00755 [Patescibacteria group bacterium]|nr:hypothetical protein [Patescibacteria group bacterium]MDE2015043.1 hypothetical protein [Patescibacteria group bacterium]MDE2226471.1 hypothetical protein [Patescibacteria group bacterium]